MSKYLILGAGPSGLSFANRLLQNGENDFLVLEKNNSAGGLCQSTKIGGSPFDIGGGHFLDVKNSIVLNFLWNFMPKKEWAFFTRNSQIFINNKYINSPIESNIWQMDIDDQISYLKTIALAGCNLNIEMPELFIEWIYWKLGKSIADNYMIPYNTKMFGANLNNLGTYWLSKLPDVSFEDTLRSCLEHKAYGKMPAHSHFYYPIDYGYGEIWNRMAENLGNRIKYNVDIRCLNINSNSINDDYQAEIIINTIPYPEFKELLGVDDSIVNLIHALKYTSIVTSYHPENLDTDAQWIYYPDPTLSYHRTIVRKNYISNAVGYISETNIERYDTNTKSDFYHHINEYAYPLNTIDKNESMKQILDYFKHKNIYGLGRWGEWQHYNSDVVVDLAIKLADSFS